MAADLDMDASGGEGWGDDAELQLDEGKFSITKEYVTPNLCVTRLDHINTAVLCELIFLLFHVSLSVRWLHGCPGRIRG